MFQLFDLMILRGYWYNPMTYFIAQRTSSFFTHGTILLGKEIEIVDHKTGKFVKGDQIEASEGGVELTWKSKYDKRDKRILRYKEQISEEKQYQMFKWLVSKIGCGYKYKSYLGYITGIKTNYLTDPNEFVCVELGSEMFMQNQINIWGCEKPTYIYPSDLLQNNCFQEVK